MVEQNLNAVEITAARLRHHDSARQPPEELDPQPIFEHLHQSTDRVGRNIEFGAGGLKSASACGRLKCTDGVERRQSTLITEPEFCGGIAPAIWTCLPQTFPDINKEQDRRPVGRATWPGKKQGERVVGGAAQGPCRQCASNRGGKNRYNPLNRGCAMELRRTDR